MTTTSPLTLISPRLNDTPGNQGVMPLQLQRSLFQLATFPHFNGLQDLFTKIKNQLHTESKLFDQSFKGRLRGLENLSGHDLISTKEALVEIANNKLALKVLCADSGLTRSLYEKSVQRPTEFTVSSELQAWAERWSLTPTSTQLSTPLWGKLNYALGPLATFFGIPLSGLNAIYQIYSQNTSLGWMGATALIVGLGLASRQQRKNITQEMLKAAESGALDTQFANAYLERLNSPFSKVPSVAKQGSANGDFIQAFLESSGSGGLPAISRLESLKLVYNFLYLTSAPAQSPARYDNSVKAAAMGVLHKTGYRPFVEHPENLRELEKLHKEGKKIIVVINHRSHLDICATVALLGPLNPRIVAKQALKHAPNLGDMLTGAEHLLINRSSSDAARKVISQQGSRKLREGHALVSYYEGTRSSTPYRNEEVGMLLAKNGVLEAALEFEEVVIVDISFWGLGMILPNNVGQDFKDGLQINQPFVASIGKPRLVNVGNMKSLEKEKQKAFINDQRRETWNNHLGELTAVQSFMNKVYDRFVNSGSNKG